MTSFLPAFAGLTLLLVAAWRAALAPGWAAPVLLVGAFLPMTSDGLLSIVGSALMLIAFVAVAHGSCGPRGSRESVCNQR